MTSTPDGAARAAVDAHLAAVARALGDAGIPQAQRDAVLADLAAQIAEMLAAPGAPDAATVLARLDAPEDFALAFSPAPADPAAAEPGRRRAAASGADAVLARIALVAVVAGAPLAIVVGMAASAAGANGFVPGFLLFVSAMLTALSTGFAARRQRLGSTAAWLAAVLLALAVLGVLRH